MAIRAPFALAFSVSSPANGRSRCRLERERVELSIVAQRDGGNAREFFFLFFKSKGLRASSRRPGKKEKKGRRLRLADARLARLRCECFQAPRSLKALKLLLRGRADRKRCPRIRIVDPTLTKNLSLPSPPSRPQAFRQQLFSFSTLFFSTSAFLFLSPPEKRK